MTRRMIKLGWAARCAVCLDELAPGARAEWDDDVKQVTCTGCARRPERVPVGVIAPTTAPPAASTARPAAARRFTQAWRALTHEH